MGESQPSRRAKLTFAWPHGGQNFSFDLGGTLKYGEYDGHEFFAESKNYAEPSDLPKHYSKFLAQCYVAYDKMPSRADHFMWIAWSPHSITDWPKLTTSDYVRTHVLKHRERVFGTDDEAKAAALVNEDVVSAVASRLWLVVLSTKQETLVISKEHRSVIEAYETKKGE
ncbi:hypothetical protein [Microbacterium marmarense]|uniref:Uncharacterized protein n=1 Tax=Microbacterium marmarense TaxID=3122051 RepID=A0ABU8LTQ2_9MICO